MPSGVYLKKFQLGLSNVIKLILEPNFINDLLVRNCKLYVIAPKNKTK